MNQIRTLDKFTLAYIECALWSSLDESTPNGGRPLDKNYSIDDIDEKTLGKIVEDCKKFQEDNEKMLNELESPNHHYSLEEMAGYDFWLTRNRHGAGFWDGDWRKYGDELTDASQKFGEFNLYVGDDGKIYGD